jgi:hypothetical protein
MRAQTYCCILGKFEMWGWRRMEKVSWTSRVKNEKVLRRAKEERNIVHRNCLLKHDVERVKKRYKEREDEEEDVSSY